MSVRHPSRKRKPPPTFVVRLWRLVPLALTLSTAPARRPQRQPAFARASESAAPPPSLSSAASAAPVSPASLRTCQANGHSSLSAIYCECATLDSVEAPEAEQSTTNTQKTLSGRAAEKRDVFFTCADN